MAFEHREQTGRAASCMRGVPCVLLLLCSLCNLSNVNAFLPSGPAVISPVLMAYNGRSRKNGNLGKGLRTKATTEEIEAKAAGELDPKIIDGKG
eukprot:CAMPEP_0182597970 /NCGR_PEP_ID=MMETSP1324-20130603/87331_1 /TAXON_ID=236786 /ORGANISM="Florenciella sp., Strain RCC1587" /LENGTH=93 /DNA_ID=CAMNT_0024815767 /DNA_START=9 /DNA_END=287 /DNA_ORIENTATION=+